MCVCVGRYIKNYYVKSSAKVTGSKIRSADTVRVTAMTDFTGALFCERNNSISICRLILFCIILLIFVLIASFSVVVVLK